MYKPVHEFLTKAPLIDYILETKPMCYIRYYSSGTQTRAINRESAINMIKANFPEKNPKHTVPVVFAHGKGKEVLIQIF